MKEPTKAARVFAKIENESAVMLDSLKRLIEFELEMRRTYPRYVENRLAEQKRKQQPK
jgi:hypothetical protein